MRWLLLDEVVLIKKGERARSVSRIPSASVSSQVLMMEMMAQTGALVLGAEKDYRDDVVFAKIEHASFSVDFSAGEAIEIEAVPDNLRPEGAWFQGKISSKSGVIAESRFLLMNVGRLIPNHDRPVTFHDVFMQHFKIREKVR